MIILIILAGIKPLAEFYRSRATGCELRIRAVRGAMSVNTLDAVPGERARRVTRFIAAPGEEPDSDEITVRLTRIPRGEVAEIAARLPCPGIREVLLA